MKRSTTLLFLTFFLSFAGLRAQVGASATPGLLLPQVSTDSIVVPTDNSQPWNLQQCIAYAQVHNISVQQQQLNVRMAKANLLQSEGNLLPNVNGFASHTYNYGRTIDRYTNQFANDLVLSENFGVSSSVTLFSGLQTYNSIQQNRFSVEASNFQVAQTQNDIGMNVASAYLQVLYAQDQLTVAQQQYDLTQKQVTRAQLLVDAGAAAKGNLLDLQSQLALEEVTLVSAQNTVDIAYLTLTQIMNLDSTNGFNIIKPDLAVPNENILNTTPEAIYQIALSKQPGIRKVQLDYQSANKGVAIAYGSLSPSVTLQGSIGTGYSGASKQVASSTYSGTDTIGATTGGDYVVIPTYTNTYNTTPFGDQFNNNVNKSFGIQLSIPIFNRFQVNTSIAKAKIQRESAQLNVDLAEQQLLKNVQQAYADAKASFLKYQSSLKAVEAAKESFKYTEERFNVGATNSVEYNNSKNKLAKAESDLIQAKFDYIFRMKVLDYYQGIPLTF